MSTVLSVKNHCVASVGEFVGTFLFLFFAFAGTQTANEAINPTTGPDLEQLLYISLIFGFSLAINVWIFFRVSGGLFNPAVSFLFVPVSNFKVLRGRLRGLYRLKTMILIEILLAKVTLALCITGVVPPLRSLFMLISQILGSIAAAGLVKGMQAFLSLDSIPYV
jgi:aquaporin related protein